MTPARYQEIDRLCRAALELEPARRAAYLAAACGGDEALRREVESLLGYELQGTNLLEQPALVVAARELAAEESASLPEVPVERVGHCRLLAQLGRGGMGDVWLAEDTQLGRKVAVKLLPAESTTQPERVRRFAQEARAASALNHPNIITIHEIGKTENTHYIITEYVEGETLRQRLTGASQPKLKLTQTLAVAAQITEALAAAHEAGIVHRDIKPENVMLRHDGYVKVLDFGLAKLTQRDLPAADSQAPTQVKLTTESGIVMGTPRYMSPEQARGERVDNRTDLFSLGVLLYEMLAGRAPFEGATMSEVIAAILRDEPPPLTEAAPAAPPELARIVSQLLRKDRAERYQTARALLTDLKELQQQLEIEAKLGKTAFVSPASGRTASTLVAPPASGTASTFVVPPLGGSSRNRTLPPEGGATNQNRRAALTALAALVIAAIAAWFYFNHRPALTTKDTILLADFENKTGDAVFDGMLKQGLAIQLQQTPFLSLFPEAQMRRELTLMKRQPNEFVTVALAREICERQNLKALITGSIAALGSHYVLTLEAINGQNGESLAREQVQAESREQVLKALSQAATQLRGQLGESLSSLQRFDRSLYEATTARLDAFKAYTQATELAAKGRIAESIPFFQRAVELDQEFALAHCQLGVMYSITDRPTLAAEATKRAYALRERVSENEKLRITQVYHRVVTGDLPKSIEVLDVQKETYRRLQEVWIDLAYSHTLLGQYEQAIEAARECIRINPQFAAPYRNLAWALLALNRFAEAGEVIVQARQRGLDHRDFYTYQYQLAFVNGDAAGLQQQLDATRGKPFEYATLDWQAAAAAAAGQWRKSQEFARRATQQLAQGATTEVAARYLAEQALRGAALGDFRQAKLDAAQGLQLARNRFSLPRAALAFALSGEVKQAQPLAEELRKLYPEDTHINFIWLPLIRAAVELQRGNASQALEQLQATARYEAAAEFWPQYLRGQAYLKFGRGAEAATEFQKILDHRGYAPLSPLYPHAQLGLARAAALSGDAARSRKAYEDFLAAWKEADGDLPILREAKREYDKTCCS